jgi:hypothetical protein
MKFHFSERLGRSIEVASVAIMAVFTIALFCVAEAQRRGIAKAGETAESAAKSAKDAADSSRATAESLKTVAASLKATSEQNAKIGGAIDSTAASIYGVYTQINQAVALAKKSGETASKSTDIQLASFQESQKTNAIQNRPRLSISSASLEADVSGDRLIAIIDVNNSGITAAHYFQMVQYGSCLAPSEVPASTFEGPRPREFIPPDMSDSIGPGGSVQKQIAIPRASWSWGEWNQWSVRGWLYGRITYRDFDGRKYYTNFRFYQGEDLVTKRRKLLVYEEGNDSN